MLVLTAAWVFRSPTTAAAREAGEKLLHDLAVGKTLARSGAATALVADAAGAGGGRDQSPASQDATELADAAIGLGNAAVQVEASASVVIATASAAMSAVAVETERVKADAEKARQKLVDAADKDAAARAAQERAAAAELLLAHVGLAQPL